MAVNQDAGWGRFDNLNEGRSTMPSPPPKPVKPNRAPRKTATRKPSAAVGNPYEAYRSSLQAGLNQAQQGAFTRGPAGYAQAGAMADRIGNMLSYDMPQTASQPQVKQPSQFGRKLGHAVISTVQFGRQVYLGAKGRGPGQPNERRKPTVPFAGSRSGTTKPFGRGQVYNTLPHVTY